MFITIYGINNIGKSTQAKRLVEMIIEAGYECEYIKYPIYDMEPSGPYINKYLREKSEMTEEELQMWFAVNRHQFEPILKSWLEAGKIVVAEDYRGTGIAWGSAKGADMEWLESINSQLLDEDLAIMLDGERCISAKEDGHAHEDNPELMSASLKAHRKLAEKYGWKVVKVIPGDVEATAKDIWDIVSLHLPKKSA